MLLEFLPKCYQNRFNAHAHPYAIDAVVYRASLCKKDEEEKGENDTNGERFCEGSETRPDLITSLFITSLFEQRCV